MIEPMMNHGPWGWPITLAHGPQREPMSLTVGGGVAYSIVNWQNTKENISGKSNVMLPSVIFSLQIEPFKFEEPFQIGIMVNVGISAVYAPSSWKIDSTNLAIYDDWKVRLLPLLTLALHIPK